MKRLMLLGLVLTGCAQASRPTGAPLITVGMSAEEARARILAANPPFAPVVMKSINVPPNDTKNILTDVTTVYASPASGVIKIREVDYVVVEVDYNPVAKVQPSVSKY
jgi:hypothetical protein